MRNPNSQVDHDNPFAVTSSATTAAIYAEDSERIGFIRRTYAHLTGAVLALVVLETALFTFVPEDVMAGFASRMLGGMGWLLVLGAFMVVNWVAHSWANSATSIGKQYAGLSLYVVAEAVILFPLLYICIELMGAPELPIKAGVITVMCFVALTAFVFTTRVDLAGWGKYLAIAGILAMCAIVAGIFTGFSLGFWFAALMVCLACGYILYDTSNVLHHYHTQQHVAASLALFSSVVLLFWYVLRILMMFASDD